MTCEPCSLPVALSPPVPPVSPARNIDSLPTLCYPPLGRMFMTVRREIAFLVKHMSCFQGMFNAQFSMFN